MADEPTLLPEATPAQPTKNCERCGIRCRVQAQRNPDANLFVKGTMRTGRWCANCLWVDFLVNCEIGPASALGREYMTASKTPPSHWIEEKDGPWANVKKFDPECLRLPHVQEQMMAIVAAAMKQYGAELRINELDFDEIVANWHLPFPERVKGKRKKGG